MAEAWTLLAMADACAGEWACAADAAAKAMAVAEPRGESEVLIQAEAQLRAAREHRTTGAQVSRAEPPATRREGAGLADQLLLRIGELQPA